MYEYGVEIMPREDRFTAFFLNAQFTGYDNRGWYEVTSEIQFADQEIDPFEDCNDDCRGHLV